MNEAEGDLETMRHRRKLGLVATACAFMLSATPALAHEFTASTTGKTTGTSHELQEFKFGPFKITCEKAVAKGAEAAGSSPIFATSVKFAKCTTAASIGAKKIKLPTHFTTPLAVEYHANGFVETGSELEEGVEGEAILAGGTAEIKVNTGLTEEHKASRCTVGWPEQTLPLAAVKKPENIYSAAGFSNIPAPHGRTGVQVSNLFKHIKVEFEGEPCEEWGKEEGPEATGTYTGSFPVILQGGNFEFS